MNCSGCNKSWITDINNVTMATNINNVTMATMDTWIQHNCSLADWTTSLPGMRGCVLLDRGRIEYVRYSLITFIFLAILINVFCILLVQHYKDKKVIHLYLCNKVILPLECTHLRNENLYCILGG